MSKEDKNESGEVTRREFLKDAGFIVGGVAVGVGGAALFIKPEKVTETITVEVPGPEVEVPKFIDPYDGTELDSFAELAAHVAAEHADVELITKFICPYDGQEFPTLSALETHLNTVHGGESPAPTDGVVVTEDVRTTLTINGEEHKIEVKPNWTLAFVLREKFGLVGLHIGCDRGECGACTVIVDGKNVYSCMMLAIEAEGSDIETIEGLGSSDGITLHPLQQAFIDQGAHQCGFCTPGFIMSGKMLLDENPNPTLDEVSEALSGHICPCGNYKSPVEAVLGEILTSPEVKGVGGN